MAGIFLSVERFKKIFSKDKQNIDHFYAEKYSGAMVNNVYIQIITKIRNLSKSLDKYSKYLDIKYHVTLPQILCLHELYAHGATTLTELTRQLNMNNSAMTGIIDRLEAKGLLRRIRQGSDRRTVCIEFTDAGREAVATLLQILEEDSFFDSKNVGPDQVAEIVRSLSQIIHSLDPEVKKIELTN